MEKRRLFFAAVVAVAVLQNALGSESVPSKWQETLDKQEGLPYCRERCSDLLFLLNNHGDWQVHVIAEVRNPYLDVRFARNGKTLSHFQVQTSSPLVVKGSTLYLASLTGGMPGCALAAYDLRTGKQLWKTDLQGVGEVPAIQSAYRNRVRLDADHDDVVLVVGDESYAAYAEFVDKTTGRTVGHRVYKSKSRLKK